MRKPPGLLGRLLLTVAWAVVASVHVAARDADGTDGIPRLGALNCTACHAATPAASAWIQPHSAPRLDGLAKRASGAWIQSYLASPHSVFPGTTMPDVLKVLLPSERATAAEALTHHLLSAPAGGFERVLPDRAAVARGERLYHRVGCVACHDPQVPQTNLVGSVPLPSMAEKWSFDALRRFLLDPLATRPSGRMPVMQLSDGEAADIAHFLLRETRVPAALEMTRFRGRIRSFDDLETAELERTGPASSFSLEPMGRDRGYAVRFSGWLRVDREVEYTLHLKADGASRLAIDGDWIVGGDSWERERVEASQRRTLSVGRHAITVDYVQRGPKPPSLRVEWEAPGLAREAIPADRLSSEPEPVPPPTPFAVDATKAAQGRALYAQLNCGACHDPTPPTSTLPALAEARPDQGCLADSVAGGSPDFHLDAATRTELRQALVTLRNPGVVAPTPHERVAQTMTAFRCTSCHAREGLGGVAADRDPWFVSNGEDLGDEGRLPPNLTGVGDKLRPAWLTNVLAQGAGVRPYLATRMPRFGAANVGHLAGLFLELDRHPRVLTPVADAPEVQREAGRKLVGTDGLSCIACHRFNRQPGHALQVADLTTATQRLNEDWFREFLLDPNRFHPGTRMPAFWPEGVSPMKDLLGGSTERQHAAIWTYLADGTSAKFPEGLSRQNAELIVGGEAVVYRGKMRDAGFRAVAVGYPGQLNAAFDAEEMRLALLWRGRFLNAGPHWGVQGMGQIRPLGTDVIVFPTGAPMAVLKDPEAAWPTESPKALGWRFRGYQLDSLKRPTLLYSFGKLEVEDFLEPRDFGGRPGLHRTLRFSGKVPEQLHVRLGAGKLQAEGPDSWRLEGALSLSVKSGGTARLRGAGAKQELLVPLGSGGNTATLEVDYVW